MTAPAPPAFTPQQSAAIFTRDVSVALSAGAGCGKTFVLTERFLSHLDPAGEGEALTRLVAITYTERAAREMRDRIRARCAKKLRECSAAEADGWLQVVRDLDSARVSTIHGFCGTLLRSNAAQAGIDPGFGMLDETTSGAFLSQSIAEALRQALVGEDADALALVLELGLERTRSVLEYLVHKRFRIDFPIWSTRTPDELAADWARRWQLEVVPRVLRDVTTSADAVHLLDLLRSVVPEHPVLCARCQTVLDELPNLPQASDPAAAIERLLESARVQGGGTKKQWADESQYESLKNGFTALRDALKKAQEELVFEVADLQQAATVGLQALRLTHRAGTVYDERKQQAGLLDFDDLLVRTRDLLRDFPDVRRRAANGVARLLVDEFQDTDPVQADIVAALCGDDMLSGKLFLVGDAKQSIYRFRRAEPRVFHELRGRIPESGRLPLSTNFRSQPEILRFVNCLFDGAMTTEYEPLVPHLEQVSPPPAIEFLFSCPQTTAEGEPVDERAPERRSREADWIARRLQYLLHDGVPRIRVTKPAPGAALGEAPIRPAEPRDVVILFRAMTDVRYYEAALQKQNLNYYVVGGQAFYAQQEVYDIVNLCQVLNNPDDEVSLAGVLRSPLFSLSDDTLFALVDHAHSLGAGLLDPPALPEQQSSQVRLAARVLGELRRQKDRLPLAQLLNRAIERTGYDAALLTEFLGERKLANLRKLIDMARQFDASGLLTLADFARRLRDSVLDETRESLAATHPESSNVIRLMSIHQSKGLEFPIVVLADMDRPTLNIPAFADFDPEIGPIVSLGEKFGKRRENLGARLLKWRESEEDQAEIIRLLYVATTRAADLLILSAGLRAPGKLSHPWMKLLSERFDLDTGSPVVDPITGALRIPEAQRNAIPEIHVHHSLPETFPLMPGKVAPRIGIGNLRAALEIAEAGNLPESVGVIPPDAPDVRRFSVSWLEGRDEELRKAQALESAAARKGKGKGKSLFVEGDILPPSWELSLEIDEPADAGEEPLQFSEMQDAEALGHAVHGMLERVDFQSPQDLALLLRATDQSLDLELPDVLQTAARSCVEPLLSSLLAREIAGARRWDPLESTCRHASLSIL